MMRIKDWFLRQQKKRIEERMHAVHAEAARRINLREIRHKKTGVKELAVCIDGIVVYTAPKDAPASEVLNALLTIREYYCDPDIEFV